MTQFVNSGKVLYLICRAVLAGIILKPKVMSEVQSPTCGRIVHFFPKHENDKICAFNNAEKVPAIVVQEFGNLSANLSVFPMNPDATNVLRFSVPHKSKVQCDPEGNTLSSYWEWPAKV